MVGKKWRSSLPAKVAAFLLAVLLFISGTVLVGGTVVLLALGGEAGTPQAAQEAVGEVLLGQTHENYSLEMIASICLNGGDPSELLQPGVAYTVRDSSGKELYTSYHGENYVAKLTDTAWFYGDGEGAYDTVTVTRYLLKDTAEMGWSLQLVGQAGSWYRQWPARLIGGGVCLLLALVLVIYLCCAAGWRPEATAPVCNAVDRIPFDLYTVLCGSLFVLLCYSFSAVINGTSLWPMLCAASIVYILFVILFLFYTISFSTRIKTHTLWRNTLIGRLLRWLGTALQGLPLVWKTALVLVGVALLEFFLLITDNSVVILWMQAVIIPLGILYALGLRRLQTAAREIARGNLNYSIDTRYMSPEQRRTAQQLEHISDGISGAVEARLKSERFKTELITNISHDIKTPLTSIINYVDLLQKEQPESEKMQAYLVVLERQSARMKKLIEDLVEASKASTGNLPVHPAPCGLAVLLEQAVGEYTEKAQAAGLELRLETPPQPVTVLADGKHLWRVFDNLLNNACKYAMPGTRVYLDLCTVGGWAQITFRNVSRAPLNISSEELMERFVRGDSSRNTEGSGLGLAIARSLVELQHGQLALTVDGDLFKVIVTLPLLPAPPEAAP